MHQQPYDPRQPYQYQQPGQPFPAKAVTKQRGLSGLSHTTHLMLTIFTCGLWGVVWFCWWLFRVIVPKRKVTRYYR